MTPDTPERLGFDPEWDATPLAPTVEDDMTDLKPCQFCGEAATFERKGDRRASTIVACTNCGARHECGEEWGHGSAWNTRSPTLADAPTQAAIDVLAERHRQISAEGWTSEHDDAHTEGELAKAAGCYAWIAAQSDRLRAAFDRPPPTWPVEWDEDWWKPTTARRDLVKAGALIIAEIERLDRAALAAMEGR